MGTDRNFFLERPFFRERTMEKVPFYWKRYPYYVGPPPPNFRLLRMPLYIGRLHRKTEMYICILLRYRVIADSGRINTVHAFHVTVYYSVFKKICAFGA